MSLGLLAWGGSLAGLLGGRPLAGLTAIGLYPLYAWAAALGWGVGNLYVARTQGAVKPLRRVLLPAYLLAPPGLLFLLWSTAGVAAQHAVPMAPVYASGVFAVMFLVPLSFARSRRGGPPQDPSAGC